jgi:hypothetical protein
MGAGDGSGPHEQRSRYDEESFQSRRSRGELDLRHEHAVDEQRVRYGDVAKRGVVGAFCEYTDRVAKATLFYF